MRPRGSNHANKKNENKHKERRLLRKEEDKRIADEQLLVNAANLIVDPLTLLSPVFRKYDRNGLHVELDCHLATECSVDVQEWAFMITKQNMQEQYGKEWRDKEKRSEMLEETTRYMIARQDGQCVGLASFKFDMDYGLAVLYCYELQIEDDFQRKGLGKYMMQVLELMAFKTQMRKVVLTVFHVNYPAATMYKDKLGYTLDESSPDPLYVDWDVTYEILSKPIKSKQPAASPVHHACHKGCC